MIIGIDCRTILNPEKGEHAGVGYYTYYLVKHILEKDTVNKYILFFDRVLDSKIYADLIGNASNVKVQIYPLAKYKKFLPYIYSHILIPKILYKAKLDVYHNPAYVIPRGYKGISVITIHDLAIYKNKEWFPKQSSFITKVLIPESIKKAKKIIAVSKNTKKDIIEIFNVKEDKIAMIYEAGDMKDVLSDIAIEDIRGKHSIKEKYFFFVGTIEPRKNIQRLLDAFIAVYKKYPDMQLVLAGKSGWKTQEIENLYMQIQVQYPDAVRFIGYVSQKEKEVLLKNAYASIYPSLYEGFGLPVLEGMQQKVPVITSNTSSLPEVSGDAALLCDPYDVNSITKNMFTLIEDREVYISLQEKGQKQVQKFSWNLTAQQTIAVYKECK